MSVTNVIDIVGWRKNMNNIVLIVGLVFFISGMIIAETLGTFIAITGGVIMGLSLSDEIKKLYK